MMRIEPREMRKYHPRSISCTAPRLIPVECQHPQNSQGENLEALLMIQTKEQAKKDRFINFIDQTRRMQTVSAQDPATTTMRS